MAEKINDLEQSMNVLIDKSGVDADTVHKEVAEQMGSLELKDDPQ